MLQLVATTTVTFRNPFCAWKEPALVGELIHKIQLTKNNRISNVFGPKIHSETFEHDGSAATPTIRCQCGSGVVCRNERRSPWAWWTDNMLMLARLMSPWAALELTCDWFNYWAERFCLLVSYSAPRLQSRALLLKKPPVSAFYTLS